MYMYMIYPIWISGAAVTLSVSIYFGKKIYRSFFRSQNGDEHQAQSAPPQQTEAETQSASIQRTQAQASASGSSQRTQAQASGSTSRESMQEQINSRLKTLTKNDLNSFENVKNFYCISRLYIDTEGSDELNFSENEIQILQDRFFFPEEHSNMLFRSEEESGIRRCDAPVVEFLARKKSSSETKLEKFEDISLRFAFKYDESKLAYSFSHPSKNTIFYANKLIYLWHVKENKIEKTEKTDSISENFRAFDDFLIKKRKKHTTSPAFLKNFRKDYPFSDKDKILQSRLLYFRSSNHNLYYQLKESDCWVYDEFYGLIKFQKLCDKLGLSEENLEIFDNWFYNESQVVESQVVESQVVKSQVEETEETEETLEGVATSQFAAESSSAAAERAAESSTRVRQTIDPNPLPPPPSQGFPTMSLLGGLLAIAAGAYGIYKYYKYLTRPLLLRKWDSYLWSRLISGDVDRDSLSESQLKQIEFEQQEWINLFRQNRQKNKLNKDNFLHTGTPTDSDSDSVVDKVDKTE